MYLAYGSYVHASGETTLSILKTVLRSEIGTRIGFTEQWKISGFIQASNVANLTAALYLLETAYSVDGNNIALYNDDGSLTQHFMLTNNTQGGVRVVDFSYPDGYGGEYTTYRKYSVTLEGRFITAARNQIVAWLETLSFTGDGGPRFVMQQPLIGTPQKWQTASQTPYQCTQSGTSVMTFDYPTPPGPLFPQAEHHDRRRIERKGPEIIFGAFQNYGVSWQYEFESTSPLFGDPTLARL